MGGIPYLDHLVFLSRFLSAPARVGSLVPSSSALVRQMLHRVPWPEVRQVAELGAGTGRITREILRRAGGDAVLTAFEKDPVLHGWLRERFPGLHIHGEAQGLLTALAGDGVKSVDAVVSGLPFTLFSARMQELILGQVHTALRPGGVFVAFQYSPMLLRRLRCRFRHVQVDFVPWNLPPAFVYTCRK